MQRGAHLVLVRVLAHTLLQRSAASAVLTGRHHWDQPTLVLFAQAGGKCQFHSCPTETCPSLPAGLAIPGLWPAPLPVPVPAPALLFWLGAVGHHHVGKGTALTFTLSRHLACPRPLLPDTLEEHLHL